jgi:hypothetical protein
MSKILELEGWSQPIPNPFPKAQTNDTPDPEWAQRTHHIWWATHYQGELTKHQKEMLKLRDILLGLGGAQTVFHHQECDLHLLLEHGQIWTPERSRLMRGSPSECHRNSCALWEQNKNATRIATGYALSEDGFWRQHSWCLQPIKGNSPKVRVLETTTPRVLYYGIVFNPKGCEKFVDNNEF